MSNPAFTYVPGKNCPAGWNRLTGFSISAGVPTFTYAGMAIQPVLDHSWREMIDKLDVTNTLTGGFQALAAGIFRGSFNMKIFQVEEAPRHVLSGYTNPTSGAAPYNWPSSVASLQVIAGQRGVMTHFSTSLHGILIPAMITEINDTSTLNGANEYDVTAELDVNAGVLTYF